MDKIEENRENMGKRENYDRNSNQNVIISRPPYGSDCKDAAQANNSLTKFLDAIASQEIPYIQVTYLLT